MISKQIILGSVLVIGGVVTLFAMTQNQSKAPEAQAEVTVKADEVAKPVVVPLTADMATEEKLLAEKQRERELDNQQRSQEADQLLSEQERARMLALEKAQQELNPNSGAQISATTASQSELIAVPAVQTRPEAVEAARIAQEQKAAEERAAKEKLAAEQKAKEATTTTVKAEAQPTKPAQAQPTKVASTGEHKVASGDTLIKLSHKYGVPVSALAAANNMGRNDALPLGRTIKIPSAAQVASLQRESAQAQTATKPAQNTQKPAQTQNTQAKSSEKAQKEQKPANTGYNYSVQVAISPDKAKVDEVVKKYRAAGYQVSTSQTSRGTRVLIGSANSYDEANALKQKLAKDSRVDSSGAWVKKLEK